MSEEDHSNHEAQGSSEALEEMKAQIQVNDVQLREPGQLALHELTKRNEQRWEKEGKPILFVRGGNAVRIRVNDEGELAMQEITPDIMQHELTWAADFYRVRGKKTEDVFPPRDLCRYVLSAAEWTFPPLRGITKIPILRPDGSILAVPGYDVDTRLIYDPPEGFEVSVPETPSAEDVRAALRCLNELIGDFPCADQASLANTLAMALTPVLREVIDGPTPLAAIDKPTPGTGATLLVECLSIANSGSEPGALGAEADDNESRKAITAALRQGSAWLFFDNVSSELKNPALARALTAGIWEDRILGVSKTLRIPIRNVWSATGNNLELSLEMARRSYWIRLDARVARPWERDPKQFQHPDLKPWVREHRAEVLTALLTLGRNWFAAGRPTPEEMPRMGSFEEWSTTLAGVLHAAGVEGFLANASALYERASEHVGVWTAFIEVLYEAIDQPDGNTATELVEKIRAPENTDLREVLPDTLRLDDENLNIRIGKQFREHLGVRYGEMGLYIERIPGRSRTNRWIIRAGAAEADEGHPTLEV
jgi:putative DNA primase/helicase